jgi:2-polyprenyl-6-methoxyphenol hydroxylase-like FAD-dependent oxidoreductase
MTPLRIAIIGAGPAGCLVARLLLQDTTNIDVPICVFEAEQAPDTRALHGGTLDLHPKIGLAALEAAGLLDEIARSTTSTRAGFVLCDTHAQPYFAWPPEKCKAEVDHSALRALLLEALPPNIVPMATQTRIYPCRRHRPSDDAFRGRRSQLGPFRRPQAGQCHPPSGYASFSWRQVG